MNQKNNLSFKDYSIITESLDLDVGEVKRDHGLEGMAKFMLEPSTHDSVRVMYNKHMADNNLRLIKFKNTEGQIEYHVHNTDMMPGLKSDNVSKLGFMSAVKMIHDDGKHELAAGNPLRFQSIDGSPHNTKYANMINRLASKSGKSVRSLGSQPITSAPFLTGEVMLVEMTVIE